MCVFSSIVKSIFSSNPQGLKTGMYYLRTKPAVQAIQFTVDKARLAESNKANEPAKPPKSPAKKGAVVDKENVEVAQENQKNMATLVCSLQNKDDCLMCGS